MKPLKIWCVLALCLLMSKPILFAQKTNSKSSVKVLFVGYDPARSIPVFDRTYPGMMSKEAFLAEYPVRMPAFKKLLEGYFQNVTTMDCRDWKEADSEPYDVTIFDFKPKALEEARTEKQTNGQNKYYPARYLTEKFTKPVIFISSTADEMGRSIGLKLDWLCLCLDADAHHIKLEHPVFKGPLEKVTPTMILKKTPEPIYHYTTGAAVPKEIPMWRVQKQGYSDSKDVRIGLVSRGNRFAEGPDAEYISSGVCIKDVGAVALGRHGNFFLWGFGAYPDQMTEEAKKVFVNAVAYMKDFNGRSPITRKYNDRMATTDDVREIIAHASKDSYDAYVKSITEFNEANKKHKKLIDDKKAAGIALTSSEEQSLQYLAKDQKINTWEEYLKMQMGKYSAQFGTDVEAYQKFMSENLKFIYADPDKFFDYTIDEDAKQIGLSNHSLELLEKAIEMLERNEQPELALRVLKRYTGENFAGAKEWKKWYKVNRKNLFFTETDGYRFMVNTYGK